MAKFGWDERKLFFVEDVALENLSGTPSDAAAGEMLLYIKSDHLYIKKPSVAEVLIPENAENVGGGQGIFKQKDADGNLEFYNLADAGNGYITFNLDGDDIDIDISVATLEAAIDHGALLGKDDDDHTQYHNDTRGDARYYTQTQLDAGQLDTIYYQESEFINSSAGVADAGKPIVLDATGKIDPSMYDFGDIDHGSLDGLEDDDHDQYLLLAGRSGGQVAEGGTDAGDDLELKSTDHATKGSVKIVDGSDFEFNKKVFKDATVQTTDASESADVFAIDLEEAKSYLIKVDLVAQSTDEVQRGMWQQIQGAYRATAGSAALQGNQASVFKTRTSGQMKVDFAVSGNQVKITVDQGNLSETVDWRGSVEILRLN